MNTKEKLEVIKTMEEKNRAATVEKLNYTAKEACQAAGVSIPTLRQWTRTPGFPVLRAGVKILIPIEPFKRWLIEQAGGEGR